MTGDAFPADPLYPVLRAHAERQTYYARWICAALGTTLAVIATSVGAGILTSPSYATLSSDARLTLIVAACLLGGGVIFALYIALSTVSPIFIDLDGVEAYVARHPDLAEEIVREASQVVPKYLAAEQRMRLEADAVFADQAQRPFYGYLERAVQQLAFAASDVRLLATRAAAERLASRWGSLRAQLISAVALCLVAGALAIAAFLSAPTPNQSSDLAGLPVLLQVPPSLSAQLEIRRGCPTSTRVDGFLLRFSSDAASVTLLFPATTDCRRATAVVPSRHLVMTPEG